MQKFKHFAYRETFEGRHQETLVEDVQAKPQKVRALAYYVLGVLDVSMVTETAEWTSLNWADNMVVMGQMIVTSHELYQFTPLVSCAVQDSQRP